MNADIGSDLLVGDKDGVARGDELLGDHRMDEPARPLAHRGVPIGDPVERAGLGQLDLDVVSRDGAAHKFGLGRGVDRVDGVPGPLRVGDPGVGSGPNLRAMREKARPSSTSTS